jgi:hypothetical protein
MNIGFHYYLTKTIAIKAGFSPEEAQIIAYACEYVDDATEHVKLKVRNMPEPTYKRMGKNWFDPTCTAHRGIQNIRFNFTNIRKKILLPFHFIPAGWDENGKKFDFLTVPDAPKAQELVRSALEKLRAAPQETPDRGKALISLGIALHSYEDTFAHQNFSSRNNLKENGVAEARIVTNSKKKKPHPIGKLQGFLGYSIGHGLLWSYPDMFNTEVTYLDGRKNNVRIDTMERFLLAARKTYDLLREYTGKPDEWNTFLPKIRKCLQKNYKTKTSWQKIFASQFSGIDYHYSSKTWLNRTLRIRKGGDISYKGDMIWFNFHQAAHKQRLLMMKELG